MSFDVMAICELALAGDVYALRALEARIPTNGVRSPLVAQERYVAYLLGAVFPSTDFEVTTAPIVFSGNEVRGLRTNHIFALVCATHEQRVRAAMYALGIEKVKQ